MTDRLSKLQRSSVMASIKSSNTTPERRLRCLLKELFPGDQVVERPADLPGRPDFFIPALRMALFADGCFFHGCRLHLRMPAENHDYWERKIEGNRRRDQRVNRELRELGIWPVRVWEHELEGSLAAARRKIRRGVKRCSVPSQ